MSDPFAICQVPGQLGGTMPPKQPFSAERAQEFGDLAVVKATESFGEEGLPAATVLKCAYGGIATPDGGVDHDGEITAKTTLMYIWNVLGMGFEETHEKIVRADHAAKRGVPARGGGTSWPASPALPTTSPGTRRRRRCAAPWWSSL